MGTGGTGTDGGEAGSAGAPESIGPIGADGFAVDVELASDVKATAPTTVGIVRWSVEHGGLTEAHIDFGLDTAYGMTAPVELARAGHRTVLVGMKPERTYHFRVVASDGSKTYTSDDRTVATGAAPSLLRSFTINAPDEVDKGFFITSSWALSDSNWTSFIVDTDGDVVWWYTPSDVDLESTVESGFARARLSADSQDVWLVQVANRAGPLRRVSIDGLEEQTYKKTVASHDIAAVSGETMAYLDYGEPDCESIFEIDKAGNTTEVFESTGVVAMGPPNDPCHGNSVRYSQKEDVYVFSDAVHDVVGVGRDGSLLWSLADKVSGGQESWGKIQHGTQLLDASLLIFANQSDMTNHLSQAIEFDLDGNVIRKFKGRDLGPYLGDVQRLPSGNTLIDYSDPTMQVVDANDAVVLELVGQYPLGYVEFRQSLYGEPLDIRQ